MSDTEAKLKQAEEAKDFVRRDRLEGLLIEQLKLATQGEFLLLGWAYKDLRGHLHY